MTLGSWIIVTMMPMMPMKASDVKPITTVFRNKFQTVSNVMCEKILFMILLQLLFTHILSGPKRS